MNRYSGDHAFAQNLYKYVAYAKEVKTILESVIDLIERHDDNSIGQNTYYNNMDTDAASTGVKAMIEKANEMSNLEQTVEKMETLATDLSVGLNCNFMQGSFVRVHDSFCGEFSQQITFTAVFICAISCISLLFIIAVICINRNFYPPKKRGREYSQQPNVESSTATHPKAEPNPLKLYETGTERNDGY
eukprot:TRINITY_DN11482_c0_g1_i9.p1 TRINITY_DN11482_c0_g1~~TRINITY_DN11482_c0_g1_i9.p1  ORF type:complete len:189 (+),score=35.79 TRINITY_DN11482_c0_g1_i9:145-711(+)